MEKVQKIIIPTSVALFPVIAMAQEIGDIVSTIGNLVAIVTPIVVALALLFFFWGLAQYILSAGDEASKATGRNIMIWGIIALFVMVSVWGVVQVLNTTFGVSQEQNVPGSGVPSVDTSVI